MLKITTSAVAEMVQHCKREYPNEACGYLAGTGDTATRAYTIANDHRSPTSYYMNSAGQLVAQKEMRQRGLESLAIYHSHVATEARPSRRDIENALAVQDFYNGFYVLVSLQGTAPQVRAFDIRDGFPREVGWTEIPSP